MPMTAQAMDQRSDLDSNGWDNQSFHSAGQIPPAGSSGNAPFGSEIIEVDQNNLSGSLQLAYDVILEFEQSGNIPSDWNEASKMTEPCESTVYCKVFQHTTKNKIINIFSFQTQKLFLKEIFNFCKVG